MKKYVLTIASMLNLLACNQAFGQKWTLNITNDLEGVSTIFVDLDFHGLKSSPKYSIQPHTTQAVKIPDKKIFNRVAVPKTIKSDGAMFNPRTDSNGKIINPLKGLTIKTVDGKTVIVENQ